MALGTLPFSYLDFSAAELLDIAWIDGGAGNDVITGSLGADTYRFGLGSGADQIWDNDSTLGHTDVLSLMDGLDSSQLWFRHVGNDLEVSLVGTGDKATVKNWYSGQDHPIEQFITQGATLLDSDVENLASAMAAFAPPPPGQTTLPQNYLDALAPVIAANWR